MGQHQQPKLHTWKARYQIFLTEQYLHQNDFDVVIQKRLKCQYFGKQNIHSGCPVPPDEAALAAKVAYVDIKIFQIYFWSQQDFT